MLVTLICSGWSEYCKFETLEQSINLIGYFYSADYCVSFIAQCLFSDPELVHQMQQTVQQLLLFTGAVTTRSIV